MEGTDSRRVLMMRVAAVLTTRPAAVEVAGADQIVRLMAPVGEIDCDIFVAGTYLSKPTRPP